MSLCCSCCLDSIICKQHGHGATRASRSLPVSGHHGHTRDDSAVSVLENNKCFLSFVEELVVGGRNKHSVQVAPAGP